jgi:hypothetical protein
MFVLFVLLVRCFNFNGYEVRCLLLNKEQEDERSESSTGRFEGNKR